MRAATYVFILGSLFGQGLAAAPADGFVDLSNVNPSIKVEMRYASEWNFIGRVVSGYQANKCFLTKEAAKALSLVQNDLRPKGYSLLVFDCYRPTRAVDEFMKWSKDAQDQKMKSIFYPDEAKDQLFAKGYIAERSGHSRGSTVDLTLIRLSPGFAPVVEKGRLRFQEEAVDCRKQKNIKATGQIDMGTTVDCLSVSANIKNPAIGEEAKKNRGILVDAMAKHGFVNYAKEWWHFTLTPEPFPERYFDFEIE